MDLLPGAPLHWSLGHMLNLQPGPNGRSAGTVSWGGIFDNYYTRTRLDDALTSG